MAYIITNHCISCNACKLVCPVNAIRAIEQAYSITAHRCNECHTHFDDAQCASICPVENAIINEDGHSLNPNMSLSPSLEMADLIIERQGRSAKRNNDGSVI